MKHTMNWRAVIIACGLGLAGLCTSQGAQGFYANANLGLALAQDVDLDEFIVRTPGAELELNPGMRFSAGGGFYFNDWVSLGLETGFIFNEIDGSDHDAYLSHVPLLANIILRYDKPNFSLVPYVGAAIGGDLSVISLNDVRAPNGALVDGSDSDLVFAWQLFAGIRYKLTPQMSIGGGYKFYATESAKWNVENSAGDIEVGRSYIHSFGVDFTFKF